MKKVLFPELCAEIARRGETRKYVAELLGISTTSLLNKLAGRTDWAFGEVEKLCEHYGKDCYELFKKVND